MNLKQLAQITGVSISTVSKIFSGSEEISEQTKKIVLDKAKELGIFDKYNKNKYEKKLIVVICPELKSEYYTSILSIFNKVLIDKNCTMSVSVSGFSISMENELISLYSSGSRADGIIVIDGQTKGKKNANIPLVYINSDENRYSDSISVDFYSGIYEAIKHLRNCGHKKIGFIGETLTKDKERLFTKAMNQCGLQIDNSLIVVDKNRFEDAGFNAIKKLYDNNNLPTAILCGYDNIAYGVINFMETHSLTMPDDISIIGIDDIKSSSVKKISLSSIKANYEYICEIALELLLKKINNPHYKIIQTINVKSEFINRASVKDISSK
ncbi:MAG: LacI family DNA-binding transcriptional regulator [Clostridia bacterium]|nr:LacI family DNA-binding transcriptional regulator [Clostridia bacterium]